MKRINDLKNKKGKTEKKGSKFASKINNDRSPNKINSVKVNEKNRRIGKNKKEEDKRQTYVVFHLLFIFLATCANMCRF